MSLFPQCLAQFLAYDSKSIKLNECGSITRIWGLSRYRKKERGVKDGPRVPPWGNWEDHYAIN